MKLSVHSKNTSPWFLLRCLISQALGRSNQVVHTYRRDRLSHFDVEQDLRLLLPGESPLLLDVGANKGQTISILQRIFKRPVIHAFEPNTTLVEKILLPAHNGNADVVVNAAALGAENGTLTFNQFEEDTMSSFLKLDVNEQNPYRDTALSAEVSVPVWTLDQYAASRNLGPIDLIKIDTQGYDLQVLQGARKHLSSGRIKLVLLELNFIPLYANQPTFGDVDAFLRGHGYALVDMYDKFYVDDRLAWCDGLYQKC